jgi:hypothetical protein
MMWAVNKNTAELTYHSSRGFFSMKIDSATESVTLKDEKLPSWPNTWPKNLKRGRKTKGFDYVLHGIIMWVSWFIFGLSMIALTRWFMYLNDKN